jgi:hypothetical protein
MSRKRLTRACYEARSWLAGFGKSRIEDDPIGKMALSLRNLSGQELLEAREAFEDFLSDSGEVEHDKEEDLDEYEED